MSSTSILLEPENHGHQRLSHVDMNTNHDASSNSTAMLPAVHPTTLTTHEVEAVTTHHVTQRPLRRFDTADTATATESNEEAGLSLLLAASLLRQTDVDYTRSTPLAIMAPSTLDEILDSMNHGFLRSSTLLRPSSSVEQTTSSTTSSMVTERNAVSHIQPTDHDVLCGRGGGINKHCGNIIYRRVVEYNKKVYKQVPKRHRMLVSRSIVQAIVNAGGRFLQESEPTAVPLPPRSVSTVSLEWTEIPFRRAVQKTSQALREKSEGEMSASATAIRAVRDAHDVVPFAISTLPTVAVKSGTH